MTAAGWHSSTELLAHLGTVAVSTAGFMALRVLSSWILPRLISTYRELDSKPARLNWDAHILSVAHCALVLPIAYRDWNEWAPRRDRIFDYSPTTANLAAMSLGYFIVDAITEAQIAGRFGSMVFHGIVACLVLCCAFWPFCHSYGPGLLLFECSTPFLNAMWFVDQSSMKNSILQICVSATFAVSFFAARIVFGIPMSCRMIKSIYMNRRFIPMWAQVLCIGCIISLNGLNVSWMIQIIHKVQRKLKRNNIAVGKTNKDQ